MIGFIVYLSSRFIISNAGIAVSTSYFVQRNVERYLIDIKQLMNIYTQIIMLIFRYQNLLTAEHFIVSTNFFFRSAC